MRLRSDLARRVVWGVLVFVAAAVLFYFVPGLPGSPQEGHDHDVGNAVLTSAVVVIVAGLVLQALDPSGRRESSSNDRH